jgi:hypothetical protein
MLQVKLLAMAAVVAVVLAAGAAGADTRTWYVEKDGSGDFTVIQDAVDAASSGDTIRIGAGRWDDYRWEQGAVVYAWVIDKSLTFIGEGPTTTIIGNESESFPHPTNGYAFYVFSGVGVTRFSDIGFDLPNLRGHAIWSTGDRIEVDNCRFTNLLRGVFTDGIDGGFVRHSEFENVNFSNSGRGVGLYTPARNFVVEHCTFVECSTAVRADWSGAQDIVVQHCTISGGRTGVSFVSGATGVVRNSVITGTNSWGIYVYAHGLIEIEENYIAVAPEHDAVAFGIPYVVSLGATVSLRSNVFESSYRVMYVQGPSVQLESEGNHFLLNSSSGWYVYGGGSYSGPPVHIDLSGCWWGTTDVDYIAQRIMDGNIDPQKNYFFDFLPIAEGPVPVQQQTWTEVKGLFRD